MKTLALRLLLLPLLVAGSPAAMAHDSWFEVRQRPGGDDATWTLSLGTGDRFPRLEFPLAAEFLVHRGCRSVDGSAVGLRDGGLAATAQQWQVDALGAQATSCWVQSTGFDLRLEADKIALYLKEIQAGPELRALWASMRSQGVAWRERYAKHARIELPGSDGSLAPPVPAGLALEALLEAPGQRPERGRPLSVTVLRDGRPLAGLPVEFVSERSRFGLWRRTDANGRVEIALPFAGRWLVRGTDLRLSETTPDTWDSRFVTLAFDVAEAQNGMNDSPNARSTNQAPASAAMASEPPTNTPRR